MTKASDIREALARKFAPPEWFIAYEVANDTGTAAARFADAVAMSIWPSRGHRINGFEIKVSRSDFVVEMKAPEKADAVMKFCDFWWLVVPKNMVAPEEVPPTWGLMDLTDAGLRVKKMAPTLSPMPATRGFMSALLRRSRDMGSAHVRSEIAKGHAEREAAMEKEVERRTSSIREKLAERDQWAKEFEAAFGMRPSQYSAPADLAETIKVAQRLLGNWGALATASTAAKRLVDEIDTFTAAHHTVGGDTL